MSKSNVVSMVRPEAVPRDVLTEIARDGARQMLAAALSAEVEGSLASHADLVDEQGRRRVVRRGFGNRAAGWIEASAGCWTPRAA
jgi:putative transposase